MKEKFRLVLEHKKISITILFLYLLNVCSIRVFSAEKSIDDFIAIFGNDTDILEKDEVFTDMLRSFGLFIYKLLSSLVDGISNAFLAVAKWDIFSIPALSQIQENLDIILPSFTIVLIVMLVLSKMVQGSGIGKAFHNMVIVSLLLASFAGVVSLAKETKNTLIDVSSEIATVEKSSTISEEVYKNSTIDIWSSLQKGRVMTLNDVPNFSMNYYEHAERLKRDQLNEYYSYNSDGSVQKKKLTDGLFGVGDVRYYRYHTDYMAVNITLLFSFIVYCLAIFKMGYLLWEGMQIMLFGGFTTLRGFFNDGKIGGTITALARNFGAIVILNFSMILYTIVANGIMTSTTLGTFWLIKPLVTLSMGFCIVVGSGYLSNELGLDDGSNHMLKSVFVGRSISRVVGNTIKSLRGGIGNVLGGIEKGASSLDKGIDNLHKSPIDPKNPNSPLKPSYPNTPHGSIEKQRLDIQKEKLNAEKENPNSWYWKQPSVSQFKSALQEGFSENDIKDLSAGQLYEMRQEKGINNFDVAKEKFQKENEKANSRNRNYDRNNYNYVNNPNRYDKGYDNQNNFSANSSWRNEPMTDKQANYLKSFGLDNSVTDGWTKGNASDFLSGDIKENIFHKETGELMFEKGTKFESSFDPQNNFEDRFEILKSNYENEHNINFNEHTEQYMRFYDEMKEQFDREQSLFKKNEK